MLVTWTAVRTRVPAAAVPWQPTGASWWQGGPSGAGRAEPPLLDGHWWAVLATWDSLEDAAAGPGARDDQEAWHVVLEPASFRGEAVLAGGARPFDALPDDGRTRGAVAVVTFALPASDSGREREFLRRFLHLGRDVRRAPGHVASLVQAPGDGAVLTFSAWRDEGSALDWAYARPQHAAAVARQQAHQLVQASGFLRCAVVASSGRLGDLPDPLEGLTGAVIRAGTTAAGDGPSP